MIDEYFRTVLHFKPHLAPVKVAVFPLKRNDENLVGLAKEIRKSLQASGRMRTVYDDTGAIGKLYRRQDEIGTPFALTIDEQTLEDDTVTIRDRDSLAQERIPIAGAREHLLDRLERPWRSPKTA